MLQRPSKESHPLFPLGSRTRHGLAQPQKQEEGGANGFQGIPCFQALDKLREQTWEAIKGLQLLSSVKPEGGDDLGKDAMWIREKEGEEEIEDEC